MLSIKPSKNSNNNKNQSFISTFATRFQDPAQYNINHLFSNIENKTSEDLKKCLIQLKTYQNP